MPYICNSRYGQDFIWIAKNFWGLLSPGFSKDSQVQHGLAVCLVTMPTQRLSPPLTYECRSIVPLVTFHSKRHVSYSPRSELVLAVHAHCSSWSSRANRTWVSCAHGSRESRPATTSKVSMFSFCASWCMLSLMAMQMWLGLSPCASSISALYFCISTATWLTRTMAMLAAMLAGVFWDHLQSTYQHFRATAGNASSWGPEIMGSGSKTLGCVRLPSMREPSSWPQPLCHSIVKRTPLIVEKYVTIATWQLAVPNSLQSVANPFSMGSSTMGKAVQEISLAIQWVLALCFTYLASLWEVVTRRRVLLTLWKFCCLSVMGLHILETLRICRPGSAVSRSRPLSTMCHCVKHTMLHLPAQPLANSALRAVKWTWLEERCSVLFTLAVAVSIYSHLQLVSANLWVPAHELKSLINSCSVP